MSTELGRKAIGLLNRENAKGRKREIFFCFPFVLSCFRAFAIKKALRKSPFMLALASGLLLAGAMPKPGIWALAWVSLVPLFVAMRGTRPKIAALYCFVTGLVYFGIVIFWISLFGYLPWIMLVILESLYFAIFGALSARILPTRIGWPGYIAVPAIWTASQWARSLGIFGFTWASLAHTQAGNLCVAQLASITGCWSIDFLVCLFNIALTDALIPYNGVTRRASGIAVAAITACVWIGGYLALNAAPSHSTKANIAIIQGSVPQDVVPGPDYLTQAYDVYDRMSRDAAKGKPSFIIWPETTIPTVITGSAWEARIANLARDTHASYVVGGYNSPPGRSNILGSYNGAHFYDRAGKRLGVYHKVHLVPYGEFVPLRDRLPFLKRYRIRDQDVLPGKTHRLIDTEIGKIGTSICFESLFPYISREETKNGAVALFVLTNDAWFEHTQAARSHFMMARLRAIENRRFVARAAATGISGVIDPYGRVESKLGIFRRGIVTGTIEPRHGITLYTRLGDYFAYGCVVIALASLVHYLRRKTG